MEMTYDGMLVMPSSYAVMDEEEMTYVEGGGTKTYYNKASTLKNTCNLLKNAWQIQNIAYGAAGCGIDIKAAILAAYICNHNAEMMSKATDLCGEYNSSTYITLKIKTSYVWIDSVSAKKGK